MMAKTVQISVTDGLGTNSPPSWPNARRFRNRIRRAANSPWHIPADDNF
jgi:hypothetical protein